MSACELREVASNIGMGDLLRLHVILQVLCWQRGTRTFSLKLVFLQHLLFREPLEKSLSAFLRWGAGKETDVFGSRKGIGRRWGGHWRMEGGGRGPLPAPHRTPMFSFSYRLKVQRLVSPDPTHTQLRVRAHAHTHTHTHTQTVGRERRATGLSLRPPSHTAPAPPPEHGAALAPASEGEGPAPRADVGSREEWKSGSCP